MSGAPAFLAELCRDWRGSVAGVDEAGRGPLAGPVVAAAVILPPKFDLSLLDDSKKLSEALREKAFEVIMREAEVATASVSALTIDKINILQATFLAMRRALQALPDLPGGALIDGRDVPPGLPCPAKAIIRGDARLKVIGAASIVAKVTRDRMMINHDRFEPEFFFKNNKGYGSKIHCEKINNSMISMIHRKSFSPVKQIVAKEHTL